MKKLFAGAVIIMLVVYVYTFISQKTLGMSAAEKITPVSSFISLSEVGLHNTPSDCWMIIDTTVYDVTSYIVSGQHNPEIVRGCGLDATTMFSEVRKHQRGETRDILPQFAIGTLR